MVTVLYARVSRDDLYCANQKKILLDNIGRYTDGSYVYREEEESTRRQRPIKNGILQDFRSGVVNTIIVTRIDRWARSLQELILDVEEIISKNGRFISILNGFDFQRNTYNASQQLTLNIFGAFAQFERELIRERTIEGLTRAKLQGHLGGRHKLNCLCGKCKQSQGVIPKWLSGKKIGVAQRTHLETQAQNLGGLVP